jgi:hypothetical protein
MSKVKIVIEDEDNELTDEIVITTEYISEYNKWLAVSYKNDQFTARADEDRASAVLAQLRFYFKQK